MITVRLQMLRQTKGSHQTQDRLAVGMVDDPTLQVMILCDTTIHTAIHTMTHETALNCFLHLPLRRRPWGRAGSSRLGRCAVMATEAAAVQ